MPIPSPSYSFTIRLKSENRPGTVGHITTTIGELGGDIGAMDIVLVGKGFVIRDYTVNAGDVSHSEKIVAALGEIEGVDVENVSDRTFLVHLGGKIGIESKMPLKTRDDLSMAYTPGVARICAEIARDKMKAYKLTMKSNMVAIVTDGTAVLGLGDIGPEAALPVMEGKAMLFKRFGNINAFPICLNTKDPDEIVDTVVRISPQFAGINLEDISAPRCFEIEKNLSERLEIPVFHDDQHGTAIVVVAGVLNALLVTGKKIGDLKIVISGLGAAGIACGRLLHSAGARNIIGLDSKGVLYKGRPGSMNPAKEAFLEISNPDGVKGSLADAIKGSDFFLGVSAPNILTVDMVKTMGADPIVFALSNPIAEIDPYLAEPHVRIMATGRSDYQNQINNVLCFPGFFRGLLDCNASAINLEMYLAAAEAIARVINPDVLSEDYIVPGVFNAKVAEAVGRAVVKTAVETGVARRKLKQNAHAED